ncbi:MAG: hypoxanthine phosphoribosyltransferase, partial [Deltaproteobacteria bacterium]|nr:hypoxanthine phosphoribosyltransferase [Candidatus Tharpella sp.]
FLTMTQILYSENELKKVVAELATAIAADFSGDKLLLLGLLKGCQPFLADLSRELSRHQLVLAIEYLQVSSYIGTASSGQVTISQDLPDALWPGCEVIVIDDIFDTGLTLKSVVAHLYAKGAEKVKTCVLLRKEGCSRVAMEPDYCGAVIPDAFIVGYGLDYNEQYRELPYIKFFSEE